MSVIEQVRQAIDKHGRATCIIMSPDMMVELRTEFMKRTQASGMGVAKLMDVASMFLFGLPIKVNPYAGSGTLFVQDGFVQDGLFTCPPEPDLPKPPPEPEATTPESDEYQNILD